MQPGSVLLNEKENILERTGRINIQVSRKQSSLAGGRKKRKKRARARGETVNKNINANLVGGELMLALRVLAGLRAGVRESRRVRLSHVLDACNASNASCRSGLSFSSATSVKPRWDAERRISINTPAFRLRPSIARTQRSAMGG